MIAILAAAFIALTGLQFRFVLFKKKTLEDVLVDPKTYIFAIIGICLYILHNYLVKQLMY